ncbi:hypothetical protein Goarm_000294, partial [Gossypium armourianum]|nr:hypothetical protein [Gossypium armourianum]
MVLFGSFFGFGFGLLTFYGQIELSQARIRVTQIGFSDSASGPGRCNINNGGCWHKSQDGHTYSACV